MPEKMKQAIMYGPGEIKIVEREKPEVKAGTVLVRVKSCGLCTWEQKMYSSQDPDTFPFAGGHEIYGVVEKVGEGVKQDLEKGDRVAVAKLTRCGECYYCRRGFDHLCENAGEEETDIWGPGGFSEYLLAESYEVYRLDNKETTEVATLAEPLACVVRSIERADLEYGDSLLVIGAGVMGYLHAILASRIGVNVIVSEPDEQRRNNVSRVAGAVIDPFAEDVVERTRALTAGRGANAVAFTAGNIEALQQGVDCLDYNGRLVVYGSVRSEGRLEISPSLLHYDEVYITGVTKHTKDSFAKAVRILETDSDSFTDLISGRMDFEEIESAFSEAKNPENYRIVIDIG